MDKYYQINSKIVSIIIPLKLAAFEWSLYINALKNWTVVYEDDTRLDLLHKHVLAQIILRVDKKLEQITKRLDYKPKKFVTINITIAEKVALEYYNLDLEIHYTNKYAELVAQEIINQLDKFDVNLAEKFTELTIISQ